MINNIIKVTASVLLLMFVLTGCSVISPVDTSPSTDGVGRVTTDQNEGPVPSTNESADVDATTDPTTGTSETPTEVATGNVAPNPEVVPGKLNYVTDFSFLDSVNSGIFSDIAKDDTGSCWYPGSVVRDLTTGQVTYKWDRAADTLKAIADYNAIYRGNDSKKYVYLTFDCGYEYTKDASYPDGVTADILDTLKEKGVKGTFFVTGEYLNGPGPERTLIRRMLDEGHIVANHTLNHPNMTKVDYAQFVDEIMKNNELLKSIYPDAPDMVFYRPPEGGANFRTLALAEAMGATSVFWSVSHYDYNVNEQPAHDTALLDMKDSLHNGAVYLLHAVSVTNAEILGELIDYIHAEGYEVRSLNDFVR